jgi:hypothetical protein
LVGLSDYHLEKPDDDVGVVTPTVSDEGSTGNEALRQEYKIALSQISDPEMFLFIDETNRGRNESRRRRAWAPRGQDNSLDEFFKSEESTYTLISAADINGIVTGMCDLIEREGGEDDNDSTRGTIDTERFLLYLKEHVCPQLGSAVKCEPRSIVVMDNASIHQDPRVRQCIEEAGALLIYCAPYSPDLNPIEFVFHQYKAFLKRNYRRKRRQGGHHTNFGEIHMVALKSVKKAHMCGYYRKIGCIRNVPNMSDDEVGGMCTISALLSAGILL